MTEVVVSALLKTPPKPSGCVFVRHRKVFRSTEMSRRGMQARGSGSLLKATPVVVVGVVVLVIMLCVYLEMMQMLPW